MNPDCRDLELLVSLRASGAPDALDPADAARLDAHLASCAACRAELAASAAVLSLARLPPPSDAERRAVRDLAPRTLEALHGSDRRRGAGRRALVVAAGVAVAAALAGAVIAPALFRKTPSLELTFAQPGEAQQAQAWDVPDLDTLWSDAQVVELEGSAASDADTTANDAALAAVDF